MGERRDREALMIGPLEIAGFLAVLVALVWLISASGFDNDRPAQ